MFISNWKKHKCHGMSEHLKDPKNTLDPRGLTLPTAVPHCLVLCFPSKNTNLTSYLHDTYLSSVIFLHPSSVICLNLHFKTITHPDIHPEHYIHQYLTCFHNHPEHYIHQYLTCFHNFDLILLQITLLITLPVWNLLFHGSILIYFGWL